MEILLVDSLNSLYVRDRGGRSGSVCTEDLWFFPSRQRNGINREGQQGLQQFGDPLSKGLVRS